MQLGAHAMEVLVRLLTGAPCLHICSLLVVGRRVGLQRWPACHQHWLSPPACPLSVQLTMTPAEGTSGCVDLATLVPSELIFQVAHRYCTQIASGSRTPAIVTAGRS